MSRGSTPREYAGQARLTMTKKLLFGQQPAHTWRKGTRGAWLSQILQHVTAPKWRKCCWFSLADWTDRFGICHLSAIFKQWGS